MKKIIIAVCFSLVWVPNLLAQNNNLKYIQLNATVDVLGNIKMIQLEEKNKKSQSLTDTIADFSNINNIMLKSKNAIEAINMLSFEGWILVSAVALNKDESGRPNTPFIAYYFRRP